MKRKQELSLLNVFLCLLVIFIHVSSEPINTLDRSSLQYLLVMIPWRLSAFAVQAFILLSGIKLFLTKSDSIDYKKYYLSKLTHIVIPYIIWVVVYYLYFDSIEFVEFSWHDLCIYILTGRLADQFYFVVVILQFYLLVPVWRKLLKRFSPTALIPVALIITVMSKRYMPYLMSGISPNFGIKYNDRIFSTYLVYWIAGCCIGLYYDKFKSDIFKYKMLIVPSFCITAAANSAFSYLDSIGRYNLPTLEELHMLYCFFAILFISCAAFYICRSERRLRLVNLIDKSTYSIYLSHVIVIVLTDRQLYYGMLTDIWQKYRIRIAAAYIVTILLCVLFTQLKHWCVKAIRLEKA